MWSIHLLQELNLSAPIAPEVLAFFCAAAPVTGFFDIHHVCVWRVLTRAAMDGWLQTVDEAVKKVAEQGDTLKVLVITCSVCTPFVLPHSLHNLVNVHAYFIRPVILHSSVSAHTDHVSQHDAARRVFDERREPFRQGSASPSKSAI